MSRNNLSEDYFLFLLRPVTPLAFATETDGNQPSRIVSHTDTHLVLSSLCRGEQMGHHRMRNWRYGQVRLLRLRTGDCMSGELCVGYAEMIPCSLLRIISVSEGKSSPGGEHHGRVWPGHTHGGGRWGKGLLHS